MKTKFLASTKPNTNPHHRSQNLITSYLHVIRTVAQLKQTHTHLLKLLTKPQQRIILPQFLAKLLLNLPGDNLRYAHRLFGQIPNWKKTPFLWTAFIRNYVQHSHFVQSICLYSDMHRKGVPPSGFTFSSVLNACARLPAIFEGKQVHKRLVQSGFLVNRVVLTALLDMYAKCGFLTEARGIFDTMDGDHKDVVAYTAMICGYAKMGMMDEARQLFDAAGGGNVVSWTTMVAGYANLGDTRAARELYDLMVEKNPVACVAMIAGYGKCGQVAEARRVFAGIICEKDASCWAAMVACYAQNGCAKKAIEMYRDMRKRRVNISEVAMVGAISACTQLGDFELAKTLTEDIEKGCCGRTSFVSNALIHMYAKLGYLDQAWQEFDRASERDAVSYSSMIAGLADHGKSQEALDLFLMMQTEGLKPNQVTFVGVLNACSHGGLIEEGWKHFKLMTRRFCIPPLTEHLTCMVDLLGKAGQLKRAYNLIMEYESRASDPGIWGALLGACKVHGNAEMAEIAARRLFELEANDMGNYVLLANTYASKEKWDDVERVRRFVSKREMRKCPGRSWISS